MLCSMVNTVKTCTVRDVVFSVYHVQSSMKMIMIILWLYFMCLFLDEIDVASHRL